MCRGRREDHFIRPCCHGRSDNLTSLVQGLSGKPTGAVESSWITPSGFLSVQPRLAGRREHWFAR
jgi:hypothetical protein